MKVYFTETKGHEPSGDWPALMSPEKAARIKRMRRKSDAMVAITAHRLLCYMLYKFYGFVPEPGDWAAGEYGKPYLKSMENIHFNISHSGPMAMCAVHISPVGADVEAVHPFTDAVARKIMSREERDVYLSTTEKEKLFFQIWTLKESYLKYTGAGLGALDSITVYPSESGIKTNKNGCVFSLIDGIPGYQAAVCSDTADFTVERIESSVFDGFRFP